MGTIVAVKKNGSLAIAADCCNVRDSSMRTSLNISHGCILQFGETFIGLNSSVGFQQSFEEWLASLPDAQSFPLNSRRDIRRFFSKMHTTLKHQDAMYVNFQQNQECEWTPMNALIVNASGIYKIDSTRGVYELMKFWAIGTAESYALGAMAAVYDHLTSAEEIAAAGLAAVRELEVDMERKHEILTLDVRQLSVAPVLQVKKTPQINKSITRIPKPRRPRNRSR